MMDWFESLQTRERLFVAVGAVVVILSIAYAMVWAPLDAKYAMLQSDVENWQRSLAELRPLRSTASNESQPRPDANRGAQMSPIIIVDQTLVSRGLDRYRQRSQPTANNGIRVEFENVAFDELVLWLGDLGDQYSMHVQAGSLNRTSQAGPGRINATLTLERSL